MNNKDIENLKNILVDLEDAENGAIINLSQEEINSLKSILESLGDHIDKPKTKLKDNKKILEQLLEDMKERANNFSFESEIMWRKIEKAEKLLEEK
jgi:hypothetical protein